MDQFSNTNIRKENNTSQGVGEVFFADTVVQLIFTWGWAPGGGELYFIYNNIRMDGLPGGLPTRARARPRNFFLPRGSLEPILVVVTIITSVFGLMYLASVLGLDFVVYVFAWDSHIYINTTVFKIFSISKPLIINTLCILSYELKKYFSNIFGKSK